MSNATERREITGRTSDCVGGLRAQDQPCAGQGAPLVNFRIRCTVPPALASNALVGPGFRIQIWSVERLLSAFWDFATASALAASCCGDGFAFSPCSRKIWQRIMLRGAA